MFWVGVDHRPAAGRALQRARRAFAFVAALPIALALSGCGRASGDAAQAPSPQGNAVTLTSGQLGAIKIGLAQLYAFPVEAEAVGSVSFGDDPALAQAESTLLGAAATFNLTRDELARVRSLGTTNGIAQKALDQAISDEQTARAALKAARTALRVLGKSEVEIDHMVSSGKAEAANAPTMKWVNASATESDSPEVRAGQAVAVSVPAFAGRTFTGAVSEVYASVDPNLHRVTLRAQIGDPDDVLRPGMLADVTIEILKPVASVGIPESGIVREGDGTMTAWVTNDRKHFVQRVVTIGLRENGQVQVLKGVKQGEVVVTDGAVFLDNMLNAPPSD